MGKHSFWNYLGVGAGIAIGAYLTKEYLRQKKAFIGNYSPLIDRVKIHTDGVLTEKWLFQWDDEERCRVATQLCLDSMGNITSRKQLEFDFQEDRVEICTFIDNDIIPDETTQLLLNELGVVTAIVIRSKGGQQERWDTAINGAEMAHLDSVDGSTKMYWREGNLEGISYEGEARTKMTYYKGKENYLFPDINLFVNGFDIDLLSTYIMGTRSRHFLRTKVTTGANYHYQAHISYLLDSFDRPIQVLVEETEASNEMGTNRSREFDICYRRI